MRGKQLIIDIAVVIAIPIIVIGGYYLWGPTADSSLSVAPGAQLGPNDPGYKTKLALDTLNSITLDSSLFTDPAYTSLQIFSVVIPEVPLSRPDPFIPPPIIEERLRQARLGIKVSKDASVKATTVSTATLSQRIDQLKKSTTGQ